LNKQSQFTHKEFDSRMLHVESMYGAHGKKGVVCLSWGDNAGVLTPKEARAHAALIIECAAAAENDELFVKFMVEKVGIEERQAAMALGDLRIMRDTKDEEEAE
jgi:hypothetical protein